MAVSAVGRTAGRSVFASRWFAGGGGKLAERELLADGRLNVCAVLTQADATVALGGPVRDGTSGEAPENTYKVLGVHDLSETS